jgi:hypothetical protein
MKCQEAVEKNCASALRTILRPRRAHSSDSLHWLSAFVHWQALIPLHKRFEPPYVGCYDLLYVIHRPN